MIFLVTDKNFELSVTHNESLVKFKLQNGLLPAWVKSLATCYLRGYLKKLNDNLKWQHRFSDN